MLQLLDNNQLEMEIRIAASIALKNFVKKNWRIVSIAYMLLINSNLIILYKSIAL